MSVQTWICKSCRNHLARPRATFSPLTKPGRRTLSSLAGLLRVSEEVQQAISEKKPVVALESTIYTHGFPYPDNLSLALHLESLVRKYGAVPATIGVLDGIARVGLDTNDLVRLVSSSGKSNMLKISRRDLAFAAAFKDGDGSAFNGGTTVAGTMILAHLAGIKVFATGGLGGVHRGAEVTMDISADLTELGRTPVAVISSGCKSFLDIPKTLEYLETQGVAVATFADGRTGPVDFPAFYTRGSGVRSPMVVLDEEAAARAIHASTKLGLQSGMLFANPIPEQHSVPFHEMEKSITEALEEANLAGATGAKSTPFILAKIKELTGSKSVVANKALVEANVIRGTKVSVALSAFGDQHDEVSTTTGPAAANYSSNGTSIAFALKTKNQALLKRPDQQDGDSGIRQSTKLFVAGSLAIDLSCDYSPYPGTSANDPELQTSNPAQIRQSLGGVGHNVARAAHLLGTEIQFCSAVGDDLAGTAALDAIKANGMSVAGVATLPKDSGSRTAQYVAVNDTKKDLFIAMADMNIFETSALSSSFEETWLPLIRKHNPSHVVLDGNWAPSHLASWLKAAKSVQAHVIFEPVSNAKSSGIFRLPQSVELGAYPAQSIDLSTPNAYELKSMHAAASSLGYFSRQDWWSVIDAFGIPHTGARERLTLATSRALVDQGIPQQSLQLLPFIPVICTKLGAQGVLLTQILPLGDARLESSVHAPHILSRSSMENGGDAGVGGVYMRLFPPPEHINAEDIQSVNGVGDTFVGTLIASLMRSGGDSRVEEHIDIAQRAAALTLQSSDAVSKDLARLRLHG